MGGNLFLTVAFMLQPMTTLRVLFMMLSVPETVVSMVGRLVNDELERISTEAVTAQSGHAGIAACPESEVNHEKHQSGTHADQDSKWESLEHKSGQTLSPHKSAGLWRVSNTIKQGTAKHTHTHTHTHTHDDSTSALRATYTQ